MKEKPFRAPVSTLVALLTGWILLLSYIFPMEGVRRTILEWVVVVAAFALLLGLANLMLVHLNKVRQGSRNAIYSIVLVVAAAVSFLLTLIQGPQGAGPVWMFQYIQLPVEISLMAVMTITLTYAAARLLARRTNLFSILFVAVALLTLIGSLPLLGFEVTFISQSVRWVSQVLAGAGARGILLGVSLGIIATGLRVLLGADRPYGG